MEKVLVIGAARSGIAVTRLLCKMGYEVYLTDQKEIAQKEQIQALGVHVFDQGHPDELKEIPYAFVVKIRAFLIALHLYIILSKNKFLSIQK